ncbi:hypothetical protein Tco_1014025 [Tanacetum coccineum]
MMKSARKVAAYGKKRRKEKRLLVLFNDKFVAIGSTEDEQAIKEMNVKAKEPSKKRKGCGFEGDSDQDVEAFNTLNEVLHILDRQDLHNLHRLVIEYYEHIPPTGLGLILHGDLTTMMETTEESDDELWRNQTEWEIIRWRLYESTGVHILELENGIMIHMLVEQRYPLTRELCKVVRAYVRSSKETRMLLM